MSLRFYHRVRIAPGLTLNLSKRGASVSVGARGAHVTVGRDGLRETIGAPGTGLFVSAAQRWRRPPKAAAARPDAPAAASTEPGRIMPTSTIIIVAVCAVLFGLVMGLTHP